LHFFLSPGSHVLHTLFVCFSFPIFPFHFFLSISFPVRCPFSVCFLCGSLRMTQYNSDAHNTHAHSPLWIQVRKSYPMSTFEGLTTHTHTHPYEYRYANPTLWAPSKD
jgi:hypothetical protein